MIPDPAKAVLEWLLVNTIAQMLAVASQYLIEIPEDFSRDCMISRRPKTVTSSVRVRRHP
jgi:stringent starvation protein B